MSYSVATLAFSFVGMALVLWASTMHARMQDSCMKVITFLLGLWFIGISIVMHLVKSFIIN